MSRGGKLLAAFLMVAGPAGAGTWVSNGPQGGNIRALVASPHSPSTFYAAADTEGLFRSTDGGRSWERLAPQLESDFCDVALDPIDPLNLYATTCFSAPGTLARSFDGGETWESVPESRVRSVRVDPMTPTTLYGTFSRSVQKSVDRGTTWQTLGAEQFVSSVWDLTIDPLEPDNLYVLSNLPERGFGVWKSADAGVSWSPSSEGVESVGGLDHLLVDPVDNRILYVGGAPGLQRSIDAGETWELVPDLPAFEWLVVDPRDPGTLYALTSPTVVPRIYRTRDQGESWEFFGDALPRSGRDAGLVYRQVAPALGGAWLVSTDCGVYRAGEGAVGWKRSSRGLRASGMTSIANHPDRPDVLYAGNLTCGVFKSPNGGGSWSRLGRPLPVTTFQVEVDPAKPRTLYNGTLVGLYRSRNAGRSWSRLPTESAQINGQPGREMLVVDPGSPRRIFADLFRTVISTRNRGRRWTAADLGPGKTIFGIAELVIHPEDGSVLYLATRGRGVLRSSDGGRTWRTRNRGFPPGASQIHIRALAADPIDPDVLYASFSGRGVYKTENGGRRWFPASGGIDTFTVYKLLIDPDKPSTIYAGTGRNGVFRSRDGGRVWRPLGDLAGVGVLDLTLVGSVLHAARGDGVYSYDLGD